jgi:hypothetical protein
MLKGNSHMYKVFNIELGCYFKLLMLFLYEVAQH